MRELNIRFTINADELDDNTDAYAETMRALGRIAGRINIGETSGKVMDTNGNSVGEWSISEVQNAS